MIYSDFELEELAELVRVGNINGIPCKCLIDTWENRTTVPASLIQNHQYTGKAEKAMLANRDIDLLKTDNVELQVDGIMAECCSDHPLPTLGKEKADVIMLIAQQKADDSLMEARKNAVSCRDGYLYAEGVLTHIKLAEPGRLWTRVAVPFAGERRCWM